MMLPTFFAYTSLAFLGFFGGKKDTQESPAENQERVTTEVPQQIVSEPKSSRAHLMLFGDFLYWKASVTGMPYAVTGHSESFSGTPYVNHESVREVKFPYKPGFRVGIGAQFDRGWDLVLKWTRFHASAKDSRHVTNDLSDPHLIEPIWPFPIPSRTTSADAHLSVQYDQLDLNFVKNLYVGSHFLFKPFFGALGARLHEELKIDSFSLIDNGTGDQTTKLFNKFDGGGLQLGMGAEFVPSHWFSLYGSGSYSLLYGKFKLKRNDLMQFTVQTGGGPVVFDLPRSDSSKELALASAFDLIAGLKFCGHFPKQSGSLTFHVSYEFVYWPNQIRLRRISSLFISATPLLGQGDVGFQGLNTGLELRF